MPQEYNAKNEDLLLEAFNEAFEDEFGMTPQEFTVRNEQAYFKQVSEIETNDPDLLNIKRVATELLNDGL